LKIKGLKTILLILVMTALAVSNLSCREEIDMSSISESETESYIIETDFETIANFSGEIKDRVVPMNISTEFLKPAVSRKSGTVDTAYGKAELINLSMNPNGVAVNVDLKIYQLQERKGFIMQGRIFNDGDRPVEPLNFTFTPKIDSSTITFSPITNMNEYKVTLNSSGYSVRSYLQTPGGVVHDLSGIEEVTKFYDSIYLTPNGTDGLFIAPAAVGTPRSRISYIFEKKADANGRIDLKILSDFGGELIGKGEEILTEEIVFLFEDQEESYGLWLDNISYEEKSKEEYLPDFSWDTVPIFAQFGRQDGPFTDEEAQFLAKFPLVILENIQEFRLNKGAYWTKARAARAIKAHNPDTKVALYWNTWMHRFHLEGDEELMANLDDWRIYGRNGQPYNHGDRITYDLTKEPVKNWWKQRITNMLMEPAYDMMFLDQGALAYSPLVENVFGPEKANQMIQATVELFDWIGETTNRGILYNGLNYFNYGYNNPDRVEALLAHSAGALYEHFNQYSARNDAGTLNVAGAARTIERISELSKTGTIIPVYASPNDHKLKASDTSLTKEQIEGYLKNDFEYNLAKFLIAAGENTYFAYAWSFGTMDAARGGNFMWYPEYDKPLGAPKGDYTRDGNKFYREFEHASVFVNLDTEEGTVTWK